VCDPGSTWSYSTGTAMILARIIADQGAHWWVLGSEDGNHGTFAANGFGGQSIVIVPELDLVVVVLANVQDTSADEASAAVVDAFAGVTS
jgi:CubicO group peptidase (beta-lactamase class C family)